jgi:hypothetical protein
MVVAFSRREFVGLGLAASTALGARAPLDLAPTFTPEQFGAIGDGLANDTAAFANLAAAVNDAGGGIVSLRRTIYIVGQQFPTLDSGRRYAFAPAPLLGIAGCTKPVEIRGNGATMRCARGLRFGSFDARSGRVLSPALPFYGWEHRATPYEAMILVRDCRASVTIQDLELDGSLPHLVLGGPWGDTGWQLPARGLVLSDNHGSELVRNVHAHDHGQDGLMISGPDVPLRSGQSRLIENVRAEHNGRQGCSLIGGSGYVFRRCVFSRSGRGPICSAPGAGFDIEAEGGKKIRSLRFENCRFEDNYGCGLVADIGDSEGATFRDCAFVGTSAWSIWPNKPRFQFTRCTFVGSLCNCYGDDHPERATQFLDCTFTDDPTLAPGRQVFREGRGDGSLANLNEARNVLFKRCRFQAVAGAVLPWSTGAIYEDCRMEQRRGRSPSYPRGTWAGRSVIASTGEVDLYGSRVIGQVEINGRLWPS